MRDLFRIESCLNVLEGAPGVEWLDLKLLIADDDRDFRESLGEVFRRRGYDTKLAADGQEALEIVQTSDQLHLLLMDVHMPRLSGLEAIQELRRLNHRATPCILMSAKLDEEIVRQAQGLDIRELLAKPFSMSALTTTVATVLNRFYGWQV
jgi:two-component system, response regulator PdtaR